TSRACARCEAKSETKPSTSSSGTSKTDIEVAKDVDGYVISMIIAEEYLAPIKDRSRAIAGRTGCGICGAESIEQVVQDIEALPQLLRQVSHTAVNEAVQKLSDNQFINADTGAVHAAAWCTSSGNVELLREDVGRHNALDKLIGALLTQSEPFDPSQGFLVISSRASYEMVQKAALAGMELVVAVSAPTNLAIDLADKVGLTLAGFSRPGKHSVYSHSFRLS
ncbi:MAG: formate dehydrogenase accessory sulfurtransferase FdhD, partial [Pseudomonadota bacterium]